jgi:hypothetical protein
MDALVADGELGCLDLIMLGHIGRYMDHLDHEGLTAGMAITITAV